MDVRPIRPRKGRGAATNDSSRFEREQRTEFDDGWGSIDEEPPRLETRVTAEQTRSIIATNDSPDVPFDLAPMAAQRLAQVFVSITSLDRTLARRMEPRAPTPERRLQAVRELSAAGVPVGVLASPMIPGLNDHELEAILEASAAAGARSAGYLMIRLPLEIYMTRVSAIACGAPGPTPRSSPAVIK